MGVVDLVQHSVRLFLGSKTSPTPFEAFSTRLSERATRHPYHTPISDQKRL